ncbi:MAG: DUF115 domain-containing protein [Treponema sp.]|nr:DUF115 domain-containing protein [Treponema sp.]
MNNSIYNEIILSKSCSQIPVLQNGRTIESKYNPEREAEQIIQTFEQNTLFFILIGIGSGILLKKTAENFPKAKIIGVEKTQEDLEFLSKITTVSELSANKNIILSSINNLENCIIQNYVPALHGNIKIFENKAWLNENKDIKNELQTQIQTALKKVSADFSVQAHFGKIWQKNILTNLKLLSLLNNKNQASQPDVNKTAAIIAAGPTLDDYIKELQNENYFIIATDTAYSILQKYNITADAAVSLDGQCVSYNHFLECKTELSYKTNFYFDLSSNPSAVKKRTEAGNKVNYFVSGHPLSEYANVFSKNQFLKLYSGSGTVTITALDLALKMGFSKIKVFGADFSYPKHKPYAKGSYLDSLYQLAENRLNSTEKQFSKLMFRTELKPVKNAVTTTVLESYKESFEDYLKAQGCSFSKHNNVYEISVKKAAKQTPQIAASSFNFSSFIDSLKNEKKSEIYLLPYIAWLRKNSKFSDNKYEEFVKLARESLLKV